MKKLLYTTTAFVLCGGIVQTNAACIATPSCTAMGYTSTSSCTNGIKCPFGNYWNCDLANKIAELEKKIDQQQQQESCIIGSILYSDMTCSVTGIAGKTPIAVVVYKSDDGKGGQALALNSIGDYAWGGSGTDISGLTNYGSSSAASKDYDSCGNTAKIIAAGDKSKYPAAWAAHEYKTAGTEAGDWCQVLAAQMGHNSHPEPTLGRRPSSPTTPARGSPTLTTVTVCSATLGAARTRFAP